MKNRSRGKRHKKQNNKRYGKRKIQKSIIIPRGGIRL